MATNKYDRTKKATAARNEKIAAGTLIRLNPIEKAKANPTSLRAAVNGKCWECVGAGEDPRPRHSIRDCIHKSCPLHPVRPYQSLRDRPKTTKNK